MKVSDLEILVDNFIKYDYLYDSHTGAEAVNNILNFADASFNVTPLIKLLTSSSHNCQLAGAYVVAALGRDACELFPYFYPLLSSKNDNVRYEICEAYFFCAKTGASVIDFIKCIYDSSMNVRLRVIDFIQYLTNEQLIMALEFSECQNNTFISESLSVLIGNDYKYKEYKLLEENIKNRTYIEEVFWFLLAIKLKYSNEKLERLLLFTNNQDLTKYYECFCNPKYFLEDNAEGLGKSLILTSSWLDSFSDVIKKEKIKILCLDQDDGWLDDNLLFLKESLNLKGVEINSTLIKDISPINKLHQLELLKVKCKLTNYFNFNTFDNLQYCSLIWHPSAISVFHCKNLRFLEIENYPYKDFHQLNNFKNLTTLVITSQTLTSLSGILNMPNLQSLSLYYCEQLVSITDLEGCVNIKQLEIEGCYNILD